MQTYRKICKAENSHLQAVKRKKMPDIQFLTIFALIKKLRFMRELEPTALWEIFYQITQIPRPSKKEEQISAFLRDFASQHHLKCQADKVGNLLISKSASKGYEHQPTVILQAHMDMVCEKNANTQHDFDKDPIQAYIDGDWIRARGTTLGADNGIGMALMLAVLSSNELQHPALECLFTVDEETGLTGAFALSNDLLSGKVLINLDSEDDGEIFIGCAGGIGTKANFPLKMEATPDGQFAFRVKVSGLTGGHSGGDIHLGLANAIKLLDRYLWKLNRQMEVRLAEIKGGNLHNAIPREAEALVVVPYSQKETIRVLLNIFIADVQEAYGNLEPKVEITLNSEALPAQVMEKDLSDRLLNALYACPHGVKAMSRDIEGLVETSTNLASVKMIDGKLIEVNTSQRSSSEIAKSDIAAQVLSVFELAKAEVIQSDGYPGWQPNLKSDILQVAKQTYQHLFAEEAKVKAIHAGLECGLFLEKYPHLDMISIGPQMYGVHSPDERLSISSTQKSWKWLVAILSQLR